MRSRDAGKVNVYIPLGDTVRTHSLITSNIKTLLRKARKTNSQMKTTPSKFKPFFFVEKEHEEGKEHKVIIVAGNTQVSPLEFDNVEQAEQYLQEQPYEMFTNLYSIFRYYEEEHAKANKKSLKIGKKEH